ncbi:hypothetical protein DUI87_14104 [Hirundo rustica rustica]|uniref:Uncharacterized protein n=1 Tax=Hirundo rustica rustica TaxID=333673 RepID=A0A3M0K7F9_HIRRU|nr:hypothetical protein DUI87_14104 [Hirundo rustica rustica]
MTAGKTRGARYICFSLVTTGTESELRTEWLGSDVKVFDPEQRFQTTDRELVWLAHAQHTMIQDIEQRLDALVTGPLFAAAMLLQIKPKYYCKVDETKIQNMLMFTTTEFRFLNVNSNKRQGYSFFLASNVYQRWIETIHEMYKIILEYILFEFWRSLIKYYSIFNIIKYFETYFKKIDMSGCTKSADAKETALDWAAKHSNLEMAEMVAKAGVDVNAKSGAIITQKKSQGLDDG